MSRSFKRIVPIGFQSGYGDGIGAKIEALDIRVSEICVFNTDEPRVVPLDTALDLLNRIEPTLQFVEDHAPPFNWDAARAVLRHLANLHPNPAQRAQVLLWAARDRNSSRMASESSHATYIETPDSEKTEGKLTRQHAIDHPILFLLRQEGAEEKGWRGTPFYWPVIRAQRNTPTAIYTAETITWARRFPP